MRVWGIKSKEGDKRRRGSWKSKPKEGKDTKKKIERLREKTKLLTPIKSDTIIIHVS